MIYATKGLKTRQFDDHTWKEMPAHKYGWTLSAEEPDEVKEIRSHKVTKEDVAKNPDLAGLEGKTIGIPVSATNADEEIQKIEAEISTPGLHHMVVKKLQKRLEELKSSKQTATKNESGSKEDGSGDESKSE